MKRLEQTVEIIYRKGQGIKIKGLPWAGQGLIIDGGLFIYIPGVLDSKRIREDFFGESTSES